MSKPVWMETWTAYFVWVKLGDRVVASFSVTDPPDEDLDAHDHGRECHVTALSACAGNERAALAAAAPALVRALLIGEWGGWVPCPVCNRNGPHRDDCELDHALKTAGFPDQASRDAARKLMEESEDP